MTKQAQTTAQATEKKVYPNLMISEKLKTTGALFNIVAEERIENGPIMSGSIDIGNDKMPMSGFKAVAESGLEYLALSLGGAENTHYYGKLFRNEKLNNFSPDYTGFITVLPCVMAKEHSDEVWENAPVLRITAKRVRNADGGARIALTIAPAKVDAEELEF